MDFTQAAALIGNSVAQNNAWSAQQAANQMEFQREMSNTAHQREIADLKAAGLNPVLSAKLGGASTPAGAMGSGDTSGTSAILDLLMYSMETANAAASAAKYSASALQDNAAANLPYIPMYLDDEPKGGNRVPDFTKIIGPDTRKQLEEEMLKELSSELKTAATATSAFKFVPGLRKIQPLLNTARAILPTIFKLFPVAEASKAINMSRQY